MSIWKRIKSLFAKVAPKVKHVFKIAVKRLTERLIDMFIDSVINYLLEES